MCFLQILAMMILVKKEDNDETNVKRKHQKTLVTIIFIPTWL